MFPFGLVDVSLFRALYYLNAVPYLMTCNYLASRDYMRPNLDHSNKNTIVFLTAKTLPILNPDSKDYA